MQDDALRRLHLIARDHRIRAAQAREEADIRGPAWWGHDLLRQAAGYYERRAHEAELEAATAAQPETAADLGPPTGD